MASKEFMEGWKAARLHYQTYGGVPPYPPQTTSPEPERPAPDTPIGDGEPAPTKESTVRRAVKKKARGT